MCKIRLPKENRKEISTIIQNICFKDKKLWRSGTHENKVYAYNYVQASYTGMTPNVDDLPHAGGTDAYRYYDRTFLFPEPVEDYQSAGTSTIRILHPDNGTGTHDWYFDEVTLTDNHSGASITYINKIDLTEGDVLTLHIKADESQTAVRIRDIKWAMWEVAE